VLTKIFGSKMGEVNSDDLI